MAQDDLATDRARSWIVAASCCFCNLTFYGVSRLSGIMLVAATHTFQVSRASAAVPFSLSTAIRNLAGVFVGHLGHRFGVGPVVATGCLIASLGSGLCFFAKDMQWLTLCWGVVFGFGFGLSTCLLPLAINQNFTKHNGTASGLSYSGAYIGSFIFPPIIVWLFDSFGLQGTFLIISGAVLNVLVAALLLREPKGGKKKTVSISSKDGLGRDSSNHNKAEEVQPDQTEVTEMWKRNINRAYMGSQHFEGENNFKFYPKHSISLVDAPYFIQDPAYVKDLSENERARKRNSKANVILHSATNTHRCNLLSKLFRSFKSERAVAKNACSVKGPTIQKTSEPLYLTNTSLLTSNIECVQSTNCSDTSSAKDVTLDSMSGSAKEVPVVPKMCFRKLLETRLLSKGKCRAKYKLKLQKLKKVLAASILKHRSPCFKEFLQTDGVKLTSFRHLQSFLCPNSTVPNKCSYLSSSHVIPGTKCDCGHIDQYICPTNSDNAKEKDVKVTEMGSPISLPGTQGQGELLPVVSGSLTDNEKFLTSSLKNCDKFMTNCNVSVKEKRDFPYPNFSNSENCDDVSGTKCTVYDDATSIDKTKDSLYSCYVPSSSPELLPELHTESKASKRKNSVCSQSSSSNSRNCFADWFHMLREPIFVIIGFTMSIQTFTVVCVVTTIEDYAKDVGIPENKTHYALMALSIANLVGTLTLGTITDRGFISRHRFLSVCFLGMSLSLIAVSLVAVSLPSLLSVIALYGLLESGVVITFPILTKEFVKGERRQAVAIASSNVLSAPTVMLVPMLIGHFRDNIGCYTGLFHLLGATSFTCSALWLVAPYICKRRRLKKKKQQQNIENC